MRSHHSLVQSIYFDENVHHVWDHLMQYGRIPYCMLGYGPIFSSNGAHMRGEAMDPNSDVGRIADLIEV